MLHNDSIEARVIEPPYGISASLNRLKTVANAIIMEHSTSFFVILAVLVIFFSELIAPRGDLSARHLLNKKLPHRITRVATDSDGLKKKRSPRSWHQPKQLGFASMIFLRRHYPYQVKGFAQWASQQ